MLWAIRWQSLLLRAPTLSTSTKVADYWWKPQTWTSRSPPAVPNEAYSFVAHSGEFAVKTATFTRGWLAFAWSSCSTLGPLPGVAPLSPVAWSTREQVVCWGSPLGAGIIVAALGIRLAPRGFVGSQPRSYHSRVPSVGNPATSYSAGHSPPKDCSVSFRASSLIAIS